ncbi:forkhead box protein B2-like [Anopheles nili]|uniref:forkhead box protein B2-like n=1 Tax=Anopheles nili TaxID=185578 RepID=UPI00237B43C7|nr:forkhead box protein B2-like [Anopheles nili]
MTPRRVKRRSVMQRGTTSGTGRQSTSSRRGHSSSSGASGPIASGSGGHHHHHHHHHRSSVRNSRRKMTHQNPVTKLLNQQQQQQHHRLHHPVDDLAGLEDAAGTMTLTKTFPPFVHNKNPDLTESNLKSLNNDYMLGQLNNFGQPGGPVGGEITANNLNTFGAHQHHHHHHHSHGASVQPPLPPHRRQQLVYTPTFLDAGTSSPIDPIYYNMNSSSPLLQQQTSWGASSSPQTLGATPQGMAHAGLSNPVYQHSTTNLNHSPELNEEYYGTNGQNRPPSVRSSYSNFHGTRPLSSYLGAGTGQPGGVTNRGYNVSPSQGPQGSGGAGPVENVFANLAAQASAQGQGGQAAGGATDAVPVPQLPHRRSVSRESLRAMQFLNSGPPAYNLNYHTPPDSETTM